MSSNPEELLYEDFAVSLEYWTNTAVEALIDPRKDLRAFDDVEAFAHLQRKFSSNEDEKALASVMSEILRGQIHSILVSLDGGTKMADAQRIFLATEKGRPLARDLHEGFVRYLFTTGRLK